MRAPSTKHRLAALIVSSTLGGALSIAVGCLGPCPSFAQEQARPKAQPKATAAAPDPHGADREAVRAAMQSFVRAFQSRDAKGLAEHWTAEGEYQNADDATIRGRDALEKAFADFFARTPEVKAELHPESLRFLSADAAIDEGSVAVRLGPSASASHSRYRALFVREGGHWRLAQLSETPGDDEVSIGDIGWLVGEWKSAAGEAAEIRTTYTLAPNKKFLLVQFTLQGKELSLGGHQVIGVDPATGGIRSWTFEADGGVGEADWFRDGDHWVLDATGTLADGRTLIMTNILRRVNDDTFTWQSVDRALDDEELPDLPPVKVTRVKPAK